MKNDLRRTIPPVDAFVTVGADRFELRVQDELIAEIAWCKVESVFAYTRVMAGEASLCLAFVTPLPRNRKDQVVVSERVAGWDQLVSALPRAFPGVGNNWAAQAVLEDAESEPVAAVVPNFVANPVQVWSASSGAA